MLTKSRGAEHYRDDATHYRRRAPATDDRQLRDAYLGLAMEYERLADVLEGKNPPPPPPPRSARRLTPRWPASTV